jgi:hypothetical protein
MYLIGMISLHWVLLWQVRTQLKEGYSDFAIFYCAGKMLNLGLADQLYDDQVQYRIQQTFTPQVNIRKGPLPFNHPPFEALLFAPLARLPYASALLVWEGLSLLMLVVVIFVLRPHVAVMQQASSVWFLFAGLAFFPLWMSLLQGQDILVLLLVFACAYTALKSNHEFRAGCFLGLGVFRFHLVFPMVVVLLLRRRIKTTLGFALIGTILGLISVLTVGWRTFLAYPSYVLQVERSLGRRAIVPSQMPNLRGLFVNSLSPYLSPVLIASLVILCSLMFVGAVAYKWHPGEDNKKIDLGYSLCLIVTLLVSYHAYVYDLSLLFLAALLVGNYIFVSGTWKRPRLFLPLLFLFLTPLEMFLLLLWNQFNLYALVLLIWFWGISAEFLTQQAAPGSVDVAPAYPSRR